MLHFTRQCRFLRFGELQTALEYRMVKIQDARLKVRSDIEVTMDIEQMKLVQDFLKHLTTLSAGSIVIVATFLEKIFRTPQQKWLVVVSIAAFLVCVLASMVVYLMLIMWSPIQMEPEDDPPRFPTQIGFIATWCTLGGFLIGTLCLGVFTVINLTDAG